MTPPRSLIGEVLDHPWFRRARTRRIIFAVAAVILAILCVFPRHYQAEAELLPQDTGGGLSAVLAQQAGGAILNLGALTGNKQSVEADLTIARSNAVLRAVVEKLKGPFPKRFKHPIKAEVTLKHKLGIIAIRGSILQITATDADPIFAKALVNAVAMSIQERLAEISISQASRKKLVAENRLGEVFDSSSEGSAGSHSVQAD